MERTVSRQGAVRPADHGLAALGLIMQLGGAVFLAYMAMEAATCIWDRFIHTPLYYQDWRHADLTRDAFLAIALSGFLRSVLHFLAGRALVRSEPRRRLAPSYAYIAGALLQTAVVLRALNSIAPLAAKLNVTIVLLLVAWPLAVVVVLCRSQMRSLAAQGEMAPLEDAGREGAAILMVVLGAVGSLTALFMLYAAYQTPTEFGAHAWTQWLLMLHVCALLIARSILQTVVGGSGLRHARGGADRALARYTTFGVVSALAVGGLLVAIHELERRELYGAYPNLVEVAGIVGLLLGWPLILRRVHTRRSATPDPAGTDSPAYRSAPDAGMAALGWLLLAMGLFQLAFALPDLVYGRDGLSGSLPWNIAPASELLQIATNPRVPWWSTGVSLLQLWAAVELIRSTERRRLAATLYGAVSTAVTIWLSWQQMMELDGIVGSGLQFGFSVVVPLLNISCWLVVPLVTLILASRKLPPRRRVR